MMYLSMLVAILSFAGMLMVAFAYRSSLSKDADPATWYFSMSLLLIAISTALRRIYWDLFWDWSRKHEPVIFAWLQENTEMEYINMCFNLIVLIAVYFALKARHELIPDEEKANWHWYSAWTYPEGFRGLAEHVRVYRKRSR
jgi:membrane protease YdiL (CAAX protease family)